MLRKVRRRRLARRLLVELLEDRMLMDVTVGVGGGLVVDPPLPPQHSTVPAERLDRLARGINVSRWFRDPGEETADWFTNHVTDADLTQIRDLGFSHIRLPLWPNLFFKPEISNAPDATMLGYLDAALDRILAHDLAVVVDIHDEEQLPEGGPEAVDDFVDFWSSLAGHLSSYDPDRVFLEVLNEPVFYDNQQDWFPIQSRLLAAMRAAAPEHTLIAAGPRWSHIDGLLLVPPEADTNIIYTFHFYDSFLFTHQGAPWTEPSYEHIRGLPYPSTPTNVASLAAKLAASQSADDRALAGLVRQYGLERWNAAKLEANIRRAVEWAEQNGVTLYAGEFGVHRDGGVKSADRRRWHHDVASSFARHDIGWSMWDYDENFGLVAETPAGRVLDKSLALALGLSLPSQRPVNQFPTGLSVNEDTRLVFTPQLRGLRISNPNAASLVGLPALPVEVTLSIEHGVFSLATRRGLTFAQGDGISDRAMRFQGSATAVAVALASSQFVPDRDYFGPATIAFTSRLVGLSAMGSLGAPATDTDLLTIQVLPVNDAPVLAGGSFQLPSALFGVAPHAGIAVGTLLAGRVSDVDPGALRGIALAGIGTANKAGWEFSLDGGATWQKVVSASSTSALLLRATDRLRFVGGLSAGPLTFHAWDQTTGAAGQRASLLAPRTGGTTAFSTARAIGVANVVVVGAGSGGGGGVVVISI